MSVDRMKEGTTCKAIATARCRKACAMFRAAVTADDIVSSIPKVGVINPKLRVIEDIERFRTKLESTRFLEGNMLHQTDVPIDPMRIVQKIAARVSKRQSTRRNKD